MTTKIQAQDIDTNTDFVLKEIQLSNGSAAAPSLSFSTDPDTGIFHHASNGIGISLDGTIRWRFLPSGVFTSEAAGAYLHSNGGSAATPGFAFDTDTSTGMYRGGSNIIAFSLAGAQRLELNGTAMTWKHAGSHAYMYVDRANNTSEGLTIYSTNGVNSAAVGLDNDGTERLCFFTNNDLGTPKVIIDTGGTTSFVESIREKDGSAASPSFTFSSDSDTGVYRTASNSIGITQGSTLQWEFNANGAIRGQSSTTNLLQPGFGSVSTPGYGFTGDEDTGMYRVASDIIAFSAGGVRRFVVSGSGAIGIQNDTGQIFNTNGTAALPAYSFINFTNTGWFNNGTNSIRASVNGNQMFSIDTATVNLESRALAVDGTAASPALSFSLDTDTGMYRSGSNQLSISAGGAQVAQFNATGSSDGVHYQPVTWFGGQSFGGGIASAGIFMRSTASVSTTPTTITGTEYGFIIVNGATAGGANIFTDLLLSHYSQPPTLVSAKNSNSPAARTYTNSGDQLQLAMASGTYNISVTFFRCPIR